MDTRRIGSLVVSIVGLGCNNFGRRLDSSATSAVVEAALDAGINFFDTADVYGGTKSEEYLGHALGRRRDEVVVATKFGNAVDEQRKGASPEYVRQAAEDSLRRLGTDRIDLYQLHRPDPQVPIEDTLGALDELGCSWLLRRPAVASVIAGATSPEQVKSNVSAAGWELTDPHRLRPTNE
jgi:aryl-alcohol dehydrogenase-like predicted oxidoreductase